MENKQLDIELRVYSLAFEAALEKAAKGKVNKVRTIGDSLMELIKKEVENYLLGLK